MTEADTRPADLGPWGDLSQFVGLRRTAGLALSPDGSRLVAVVQEINDGRSEWVPSLWEIPLDGASPYRLTDSPYGAASPAFLPDNSLVYVSGQPWPDPGAGGGPALWLLAEGQPPRPLARRPGGLTAPLIARDSGAMVAVGQRLSGSTAENDAARLVVRRDRRISAVLQTWMPVRDPFRDLDIEYPQLLFTRSPRAMSPCADLGWRDLAPDAGKAMVKVNPLTLTERSISADGDRIAAMWSTPGPRGAFPYSVVLIETATGKRTALAPHSDLLYTSPKIAPDGRRIAAMAIADGTFATPVGYGLHVFDVPEPDAIGPPIDIPLGDLYPVEWAWSPSSDTLYVSGHWRGRGAVLAADPVSGDVVRRLVSDAVYAQLAPSPDGRSIYALRSAVDAAPAPVRLDVTATDQRPATLGDPAPVPPLPGRMHEVSVAVDGGSVRGYLCLPDGASAGAPAPIMQWIHGGPLASFNSWSWGWNPWVMVARGWAVLLPDPALSTGYGPEWIARAWPHRAVRVWADIEALLDEAGRREDIDVDAAACLGASFGGFMTNWIAGHTDRFRAIVTHAGLYALDQHHDTNEQAYRKNRWFGTRSDHPDWYAQNSPHDAASRITTPMLITHGNVDYNVPVTEALRLWWDLCGGWAADPAAMPHRLLRFTDEAHFVTRPANAEIWYQAVLAFCSTHVLGRPMPISELL